MTDDHILQMRAITKEFPGVKALQDVSLSVRRQEIHAICGENGAGKSTLMKVLSGVYPAGSYSGEIHFDGELCQFADIRHSEQRGIVIIHQELALSPYLSIAENIFLGNERAKRGIIDWNETNAAAAALLERVGLQENPITKVMDIGVGKQQLVEIAKALSKDVKLLILDEPTAALNDIDSDHLLGLLRGLREEGITCIIISHKLNEIKAIADSTTIIRDGKSIETLEMTEEVTEDRIIKAMVGRDLDNRYPERTPTIGEELLRIEDWTVHHPQHRERIVVNRANLTVRRGEIVGLAGLMGAGRTELAMSVFGRAYGFNISGKLYKSGKPIQARSVREAIDHGLAYATEDRKVYGLNLIDDIKRNISGAALGKLASAGWVDDGKEFEVANSYRTSMNIKAPTVLSVTGKLSGGNQQKVVLSKWMFTDPDVLILDEPTRGIDVGAKYEIYTIINRLADEGKGVLVISSELPELLGICDRIYTLSAGHITGEVARAEATQEILMQLMTREQRALTDLPPEAIADPENSVMSARTVRHLPRPQEGLIMSTGIATKSGTPAPPPTPSSNFLSSARKGLGQSGIFIAFLAILALFAILTGGTILTPQNISNLVVQNSYILILAIGMVIVIIAGHIDLSVGSVVGFTGALAGVFIVNMGLPIWLGVVLVLVIGGVVGAWQGYWVAYFGIPAFIVTLAGMLIFRGGTLLVLGNKQISPFPDGFRNISAGFADGLTGYIPVPEFLGGGDADLFTLLLGAACVAVLIWTQARTRAARVKYHQSVGSTGAFVARMVIAALAIMYFVLQLSKFKGLPYVLFVLAILVLAYSAVMNRSVFGRHVYAIGGNLHAAELSGIKVKAVTFWVFVNMGVLAALAGIVFAARLNLANPTNGLSFELDAIAAAFIGGAAVTGGVGRVIGAIVGGLTVGVLNNGMSILGVDVAYQQVIKGLVLLGAVAFDVYSKRRAGSS